MSSELNRLSVVRLLVYVLLIGALMAAPDMAFAQASPFDTGLNSLQDTIITWLTPLAIILVMVLGAMAMANRMSWGWCITCILGIVIAFGAQDIVEWVQGMFGVG